MTTPHDIRPRRFLSGLVICTSLVGCDSDATSAPADRAATRFAVSSCPKPLPAGLTEGQTVRCGTLSVPENHSEPNGKNISLSVMIVKGSSTVTQDPILHFQGGPGGSYAAYADVVGGEFGLGTSRATGREIVFFDQRGTGHSRPSLMCNDNESPTGCLGRLARAGIDLASYNTEESARDVEMLRLALGYEKWNLYGQSYGTVLAQTVMRLYPSSVRSAVLESVSSVPFDVHLSNSPKALELALGRVFQECAADASCAAAFPSPADDLAAILAAFDEADADPSGVIALLSTLTQFAQGQSYVPLALRAIATNDEAALAGAMQVAETFDAYGAVVQQTLALGSHIVVNCYDYGPLRSAVRWASVNGGAPAAFRTALPEQPSLCDGLPASRVSPAHHSPFQSSIPTLELSGSHDSNTPKETADALAASLTRGHRVLVPGWGHIILAFGEPCSTGIFRDFVRDPSKAPVTSCFTRPGFPKAAP